MSNKALLLLEDGLCFEGNSFGHLGTVYGEVIFNTGITGYQEVLTDPSYYGQLITFTYPEIGNTGINEDDNESGFCSAKGIIARQIISSPSNWRSKLTIDEWLKDQKVVGIYGVDTRALVRHLREKGSLRGVISNEGIASYSTLLSKVKESPSMKGLNLVNEVTTKKYFIWNSTSMVDFDKRIKRQENKPFKVVAIDFGIKRSILDRLVAHGCDVTVLPAKSTIKEVLAHSPEGIFFSNGPGDPSVVTSGINLARELIKNNSIPIFGICLGHQILGLAIGGKTFKLSYGHRGLNHPCGSIGRVEITSQNHGFALDASSLPPEEVEITHLNLNDKTVAAISFKNRPIFGVQYHPEASPGPHDADYHFERFVSFMANRRLKVV